MQNTIRATIKKARLQMTKEAVINNSNKIVNNLFTLDFLFQKQNYFIYKSFKNEVETAKIIERLQKLNKTVAYPVTFSENMIAGIPIGDETTTDKFGVVIPKNYKIMYSPEVVFVPLIACDKNKNRIGFGKGYYDKYLSNKNCIKVGICYNFQVVDGITPNKTDVPLDIIVTESEIIK